MARACVTNDIRERELKTVLDAFLPCPATPDKSLVGSQGSMNVFDYNFISVTCTFRIHRQ